MKLLLDTHTVIWWMEGSEKLSSKVKAMLGADANELYVSTASVWEIAIKASLGKLPEFKGGAKAFLKRLENIPVTLLPIAPRHIETVETLPFHHRDPFDRLLIATAKVDGMTLLTSDANLHKYGVRHAW